jgi:uncharacterized membrane protein YfcA
METTVILVLLTLFLSSMVRSSLGFGDALVAMPVLTLVVSFDIARPLVALLSLSVAIVILVQDHKDLDYTSTWKLSLGAIVGVPLGHLLLIQVEEWFVRLLLGLLVISFCLFRLFSPTLSELKKDTWAPFFGLLSGFFGGAYNTFGPPIVVYGSMRRWKASEYRVSVQGFYLPVCLIVLSVHAASGLWTPEVFRYCGAALPVVLAATFLGRMVNRRLANKGQFDRIIYVALVIVAMVHLYGAFKAS